MGFLDNTGVARLWQHILIKVDERLTIDPSVAEEGAANPINADSLGGVLAKDYALKSDLEDLDSVIATDENNDGNIVLENYVSDSYAEHIGDFGNPHKVTIAQITGLSEELSGKYSASNPPLYPVTSVNGMTGAVDVELYPVGSVYISTSSTSPASLFGGTWEQIKDRFLLGAGTSYAAGSTGGAATHTLTKAELANHDHELRQEYPTGTSTYTQWMTYFKLYDQSKPALVEPWEDGFSTKGYAYSSGGIRNTTAGQPHNNMPPYLTVYMWRRIA